MLEDGNHWSTGRSGKVAVGGILHGLANQIKPLEILWFTLSLDNPLQDFAKLYRTNPAGHAFTAGNTLLKL